MHEPYQKSLDWASKNKKLINKKINRLRKMRKGAVDSVIHQLHDEAFAHIDCLQCANCCTTTGPRYTQPDIDRISAHLNLSPTEFIDQYLRLDEDDDYVLQLLPCPFLGIDNHCSIYHVRPKACKEYPHTDRVNQPGILTLAAKNSRICPAVANIFENLDL